MALFKRWWNLLPFSYLSSCCFIFQNSCLSAVMTRFLKGGHSFSSRNFEIKSKVNSTKSKKYIPSQEFCNNIDSLPTKCHYYWSVKDFENQIWGPQRTWRSSFTKQGCYTLSEFDFQKLGGHGSWFFLKSWGEQSIWGMGWWRLNLLRGWGLIVFCRYKKLCIHNGHYCANLSE